MNIEVVEDETKLSEREFQMGSTLIAEKFLHGKGNCEA